MAIIKKLLDNPAKIVYAFDKLHISDLLPDYLYLKLKYRACFGKKLDLKAPKTFNEKLQWLKLYDRNPEYTTLVDKYEVKKHVANILGEEYIIPTLGVWDRFEDIDFESLPNQFVLKCTHDSGGLVICKDKSKFDKESAKIKIESSLKTDFYMLAREWPYKNVPRKIICEKYIQDSEDGGLKDYKFFCFDGVADNVMVVEGRSDGNPKFYHFNKKYELRRLNRLTRSLPENFVAEKPAMMDEMFRIAELLSAGIPHVRIDLYCVDGQIYFGEYTLYNQGGYETGFDDYSDGYLGDLIRLPMK